MMIMRISMACYCETFFHLARITVSRDKKQNPIEKTYSYLNSPQYHPFTTIFYLAFLWPIISTNFHTNFHNWKKMKKQQMSKFILLKGALTNIIECNHFKAIITKGKTKSEKNPSMYEFDLVLKYK